MLTEEVVPGPLRSTFYPLFLLMRLGVSSVIVFLYDKPLTQCTLIISMLLITLVFNIVARSQRTEFEKVTTPLDILTVMAVVLVLIVIMVVPAMLDSTFKMLGWMVFGIIVVSVFKTMVYCVYMTGR